MNSEEIIWKPHVTVAAVVEDRGRFLLVEERVDGRRVFNQPADHLEEGESLLQAVVRETLEETGRQFRPAAVVGLYRWQQPGKGDTYLRVTFSGQCGAREPDRQLDPDIEQALWMAPQEIRSQADSLRSPLVWRSIEDHLAGHAYPLSVLGDVD